jgi:DNA-binding NtrC family response regulator
MSAQLKNAGYEPPLFALLDPVNAVRRDGETAFDAVKRELINEAMTRAKGNQAEAGRMLGISASDLYQRLKRLRMRLVDEPVGAA